MSGFSYHNIFETKGIEYLAIIAFFLLLVPFWFLLNRSGKLGKQIKKGLNYLSINKLRVPKGVFHCKNHTWAFMEQNGQAKVGLDELLVNILGSICIKCHKQQGDFVQKGDLLTVVERNGKLLRVFSPISGEIMAVNERVEQHPESLNQDPYGSGWLFKIQPTDWVAETGNYYLSDKAVSWSDMELQRIRDFFAKTTGSSQMEGGMLVLQDGGVPMEDSLDSLPEEAWMDFQEHFLARVE